VFVDLTAAYNTVWHRGLTCKRLRLLPDRHTVHMIMEMVGNSSFILTTWNGQKSRLRRLKNVSHRNLSWRPLSSTSTFLTCQTPSPESMHLLTTEQSCMHADGDWQAVEGALSKDMATLGVYFHSWKLKLSTTKRISAVFHLNNKEAKHELKVNFNNETLPFCSEPKYLGVTLDRSLTYRRHFDSLRKKLTSRVALLKRFCCLLLWTDEESFCLRVIQTNHKIMGCVKVQPVSLTPKSIWVENSYSQ